MPNELGIVRYRYIGVSGPYLGLQYTWLFAHILVFGSGKEELCFHIMGREACVCGIILITHAAFAKLSLEH